MIKYHSSDGQTNPLIELQLREFQELIEVRKMEPFWDYSSLVETTNARWRLLALALMCINGQLAGNGVRRLLLLSLKIWIDGLGWFLFWIVLNSSVRYILALPTSRCILFKHRIPIKHVYDT